MIDTQALRNKVLDAAIRGKLTQQLPEDGNAEDLCNEILKEKQKLIKECKLKKEKPLSEITDDEIPFEIPENWKWVHLHNVIYHVGNKNNQIFASEIKTEGKYPVISQGTCFIDGYCDNEDRLVREFPVVMFGDHTKNVKYIDFPFVIGADGTKFLKPILINPRYLFYWTLFSASQLNNRGYARHYTLLAQILFPLPPLAEQKRIVDKVESIFIQLDLIDKEQKKLADNSQGLRNKLIELGIRGKLTQQLPEDGNAEDLYDEIQKEKQRLIKEGKIKKDKNESYIFRRDNSHYEKLGDYERCIDEKIPFEIPSNWKWVMLPEIASTMLGKTLNRSTDKGEIKPYLCSINIYWEGINLESVKEARFSLQEQKQYRIQKNDILICEGGDVGRTIIWDKDQEMYYQNALHRVRFFGTYIIPEYFRTIMECYKIIGLIDAYSTGITIKHFVQSALNELLLPIPPIAEQKRIVEKLNQLLYLCNSLII